MLTINQNKYNITSYNQNYPVKFGLRTADPYTILGSSDRETVDAFLRATEEIRRPDFALGEQSLLGLLGRRFEGLTDLLFSRRNVRQAGKIKAELGRIIDNADEIKQKLDITA